MMDKKTAVQYLILLGDTPEVAEKKMSGTNYKKYLMRAEAAERTIKRMSPDSNLSPLEILIKTSARLDNSKPKRK